MAPLAPEIPRTTSPMLSNPASLIYALVCRPSAKKNSVKFENLLVYGFVASEDAHTYNTMERTTKRIVKMKMPMATQEQIFAAFAIPASG